MSENRAGRYTDPLPFKGDKKLVSLFKGENVDIRMDDVRKSIHYVRDAWNDSAILNKLQKRLLDEFKLNINSDDLRQINWCDADDSMNGHTENFDLIRWYTTDTGYDLIFQCMNEFFREKDIDESKCNVATYLVELLNIELYNYIMMDSSKSAFNGTIYRGLILNTKEACKVFENLTCKDTPISDRKLSVPLSFMSASLDKNIAIKFVNEKRKGIYETPLIFEIHVRNLDEELLEIYKSFYPDSPVTSLCSVPIENLSQYKNEREVVMRGAFFQVINIRYEFGFVVAEMLMINANRDHIKTNKLNGGNAQNLFKSLINFDKMRKCKEFMTDYDTKLEYIKAENSAWEIIKQNKYICERGKNK